MASHERSWFAFVCCRLLGVFDQLGSSLLLLGELRLPPSLLGLIRLILPLPGFLLRSLLKVFVLVSKSDT